MTPEPSSPKDNSKFEILLVKILILKTKNKIKIFQLLKKKSNFCFLRIQSMVPLDKGLQWVNVKKAVQTNSSTFWHNQTHPGIIQPYSGIFRTVLQ